MGRHVYWDYFNHSLLNIFLRKGGENQENNRLTLKSKTPSELSVLSLIHVYFTFVSYNLKLNVQHFSKLFNLEFEQTTSNSRKNLSRWSRILFLSWTRIYHPKVSSINSQSSHQHHELLMLMTSSFHVSDFLSLSYLYSPDTHARTRTQLYLKCQSCQAPLVKLLWIL